MRLIVLQARFKVGASDRNHVNLSAKMNGHSLSDKHWTALPVGIVQSLSATRGRTYGPEPQP